LTHYLKIGQKQFPADLLDQADTLLEQLQQFAAFADFHKPIVRFTGADPNHPDQQPFAAPVASQPGIDIGQLLMGP
jgi:hypothetical protein